MMNKDIAKTILSNLRKRLTKKANTTGIEPTAQGAPDNRDDLVSLDFGDILAGSKKLIDINRGDAQPDRRDSFAYKRIYTTGDLIAERIKIDADRTARTMMRKLSKSRSLKNLPGGIFTKYAEGQLINNPLSSPIEETNPLQVADHMFRITQMGPGGIGTSSALTEEMQNVDPSEFGFIDPVAGPECFGDDQQVMTDSGWKLWKNVKEGDRLVSLHTKKRYKPAATFVTPKELITSKYTGPMVLVQSGRVQMNLTPNHRVWFRHDEESPMQFCRADKLLNLSHPIEIATGLVGVGVLQHVVVLPQEISLTDSLTTTVYCARVPSGLLFVRGTYGSGYWSGNSEKAGVDVRATHNVRRGSDGRLYQRLYNPRLSRYEWLSARDLMGKTVGFAP